MLTDKPSVHPLLGPTGPPPPPQRPTGWKWPLPAEVDEEELPVRLDGATWLDAEAADGAHPEVELLKFVEERDGTLYIVDRPTPVHDWVVFSVSRELTKWAVRNALNPQLELMPSYSLPGMWPRRVCGRLQEADGGWTNRLALAEGGDVQGAELLLVLETAVGQSAEAAVAKARDVWFGADGGPRLAVVVSVDVAAGSGRHGFRALLLDRDAEAPLADVSFGFGAAPGGSPSLALPLDRLYGKWADQLPTGLEPLAIDLGSIKRPVLACIESMGVKVAEVLPEIAASQPPAGRSLNPKLERVGSVAG